MQTIVCSRCHRINTSDTTLYYCQHCGYSLIQTPHSPNQPTNIIPPSHFKKPMGIVLVVIYTALSGVLSLLAFVLAISALGILAVAHVKASTFLILQTFLGLPFGVLALATAYGLWSFQTWGYTLAKLLYPLVIAYDLITILAHLSAKNIIVLQLAEIGFAIWIFVYLLKPQTKALYHTA